MLVVTFLATFVANYIPLTPNGRKPVSNHYSVARSTDISVFYGYLGLFQEYGRISNVYSILRIFTVPLLRARRGTSAVLII